jgi:hypothetical protein
MAIGRILRREKVSLKVKDNGFCVCACVLILAGAVERPTSRLTTIGIHRPYLTRSCKLRPDLEITPSSRFTVAEHKAEPGMPVRHLFTEGRALITSLLWIAFISSLMGHHFLTNWLPTVLDSSGIPLAHAVVAGSLIQAGGAAGSLIVGRLVDRIGMSAIVAAYILSARLSC